MCKPFLSTQTSQALNKRCRPPNLPFTATGLVQGARLSWKLSLQSLFLVLVIFGILPDFTGVASISPAHRKQVATHHDKDPVLDLKSSRPTSQDEYVVLDGTRIHLTTANNVSLAVLSSEWNGRRGTSKETSLPRKSPLNSYFYIDTKRGQSDVQLNTKVKAANDPEETPSHPDGVANIIHDHPSKWLHRLRRDNVNSNNEIERILFGASTQKSDLNQQLINDGNKRRSDQISSCPNCVGSNRLSIPLPAATSASAWSKLRPSKFSTLTRSRRSLDAIEKFKEHNPHDSNVYTRNREQLISKSHHSSTKRRKGFPTPLKPFRHHGNRSAWWWNLIRQNRPASVDSTSVLPWPENPAQHTYKGIGGSSNVSSSALIWPNNVSFRVERSNNNKPTYIHNYTFPNHNMCLVNHGLYNASGDTVFDSNSTVEDGKLIAAEKWVKEICNDKDKSLEDRIRRLINGGLEGICDDHKICEIFSPEDLQEIASDYATCSTAVKRWWRVFHRLFSSIRNFEEIYQRKFDSFQNSQEHNNTRANRPKKTFSFEKCKVSLENLFSISGILIYIYIYTSL